MILKTTRITYLRKDVEGGRHDLVGRGGLSAAQVRHEPHDVPQNRRFLFVIPLQPGDRGANVLKSINSTTNFN